MTIRTAENNDIPMISEIVRKANQVVADRFDLRPDNAPKHPSNCTEEWIQDAFEKGIAYYVLEDEGRACGCVALEQPNEEVCYLERLAVLPDCQRKGYGEALVKHIFAEAEKLGAQRVEIGTIAEYSELSAWYEKLGFALKQTRNFEHLPFNVAFMYKEL